MPSVNYMNQSAPFWDFVASLEQDGRSHPFFSQNQNESTEQGHPHQPPPPPPPPFGGSWGGWGMPYWGAALPHRGPPPPPEAQRSEKEDADMSDVKEKQPHGSDQDNGEGPSNSHSDSDDHARGHGRRGRCGPGRHGRRGHGHGHGPRPYGFGGGFGPRHGPGHHGRRGGWGGWGGWGGHGRGFNPFDFGLFDPSPSTDNNNDDDDTGDFSPDTDVFDTPTTFVVHVALPGAKKEDVGVNWDAEKSELAIAGVIYRPGDEEFLKTLAMIERKVGPFERKIRLGTRANPAQIDAEGITAKLEDGLLKVEVPKLEKEGFVEVRKVDIE